MQGVKTKFLTKDDIGAPKMKTSKVLQLAEEGLNPDVMKKIKDPKLKDDLLKLEDDSVSYLGLFRSTRELILNLWRPSENNTIQIRCALSARWADARRRHVRKPGSVSGFPEVPTLLGR